MQTGEDTQGLRKILDMTRLISLVVLAIHCYLVCYQAFRHLDLSSQLTDRLLLNLSKLSLFRSMFYPKLAALIFLVISLIGVKGRKDEKANWKVPVYNIGIGLSLYSFAFVAGYLSMGIITIAALYISITLSGYLLILSGGARLTRLLKVNLNKDVFNLENETFPQAIGAVVGLIGAVKVFNKWNSGEPDTNKVAAAWFGSCVFLVVVATVLKSFFGI